MKKNLFALVVLAILAMTLSACNNKAALKPASWQPWTWGDQTLPTTRTEKCVSGATTFTVDGVTYPCEAPAGTLTDAEANIMEARLAKCVGGALSFMLDDVTYPCDAPKAAETTAVTPKAEAPKAEATTVAKKPAVELPSTLDLVQAPDGVKIVGGAYYNPCESGASPENQIEPLYESGKLIPNAYTGLDLNSQEIGTGLRYGLLAPKGSYVQIFTAVNDMFPVGDHYTYDMMGAGTGTRVIGTAYTIWCDAGNYNADNAGKVHLMNAQNIPQALLEAAKDIWMPLPANGLLPVPASWLK